MLPFEKTRVKLEHAPRSPSGDYINANYVGDEYIACCAPVPLAIADFWHMVWQCDVHVILMLTNFVERDRPKADIYWNTRGQAVDFGGVVAQLIDEQHTDSSDGFITRLFKVWTVDKHGRELESRVVKHLQLTIWPDHGVLRDFRVIAPLLDSMNSFRLEASRSRSVDTRVVVHCSAGIGRSGTVIAIDMLAKQIHQAIATNGSDDVWRHALDVQRVVHRIRSERPGMVQTPVRGGLALCCLFTVINLCDAACATGAIRDDLSVFSDDVSQPRVVVTARVGKMVPSLPEHVRERTADCGIVMLTIERVVRCWSKKSCP